MTSSGAALLSSLLQISLFTNIWPPPPVEEPPPPPRIQQTLGGARNADCQRDLSAGNIFGETAQVRGEPGLPPMPPALARAAAAARIAQSGEQAMVLLSEFLGDGTTTAGQLARIQLAYALLRTVPTNPSSQAESIRSLLTPADRFAVYSDAHFIRAVLADAEGKQKAALEALDTAITLNPKYYNAVMLRAIMLMRRADASFRATGECEPLFDSLASAIVPVARLGSCPLQLAHFRLALDRGLPRASSPRRVELMRAVDIALAFAARKDAQHNAMLQGYAFDLDGVALCEHVLAQHDFGNFVE